MFPYRDNLISSGTSWAVISLIAMLSLANAPLFFSEPMQSEALRSMAFYPILFSVYPLHESYTLVTASVLHADIVHLLGNCLFLVVFGKTLEHLFGAKLLLLLFPLLGVGGFLLHWVLNPDSPVPVIGASGAVAALMGAYLPLFPNAKIRMVIFLGWFWKRVSVPAWVFIPYWAGLQLVSLALGTQDGVAYAVHAGSFAVGAMCAIAWKTSYLMAEEKLSKFNEASFRNE